MKYFCRQSTSTKQRRRQTLCLWILGLRGEWTQFTGDPTDRVVESQWAIGGWLALGSSFWGSGGNRILWHPEPHLYGVWRRWSIPRETHETGILGGTETRISSFGSRSYVSSIGRATMTGKKQKRKKDCGVIVRLINLLIDFLLQLCLLLLRLLRLRLLLDNLVFPDFA